MISIKGVTRKYGQVIAVNSVTAEIARGEVVGLLGHNGAGKTTLMKMLTGYLEPTEGTIAVGGHDVVSERQAVQRMIGYLPESAPLYPEMLVQEYLFMMAELRGVAAEGRERAVARAAAATGLHQRLVQPIGTLSKGFRQRVGIAQAIVHQPAVLVLDEPTNGLDPVQIQSIRDLIRKLAESTTVILSTHILQEVEAVADRVLVMIDGVLAADSPLEDMLRSNTIRVSLAADTRNVPETLRKLNGVSDVVRIGADPHDEGFVLWAVRCATGTRAGSSILDASNKAGWRVGSLAPETLTLEGVFKRLQQEHIERSRTQNAHHQEAR